MNILIVPKIIETYPNQFEYCIEFKLIKFLEKIFNKPTIEIYFKNLKLNKFDLVVLSGGNNSNSKKKENINRNKIDHKILNYALKKKIKILGICHGAQFIAKKFGLKLNKIKNHVGEHQIKLIFKNKIFEKKVNSFHEMGIKKNKNRHFNFFAISNDNSVEGFHLKNKKILGIQWHPERYEYLKEIDKKIIHKFYGTNNLSSW